MRSYPQRVRDNILPLSVAGTLPEAFEEWSFTENTVDHENAVETCHLCEHEELRYHFEIINTLTRKTLWVGSQCILKFNLSVFENSARLTPQEAKKKLERLTQQMRLESCLNALTKLAAKENNDILTNALKFYEMNKYLTPKFAFVVLWRLNHHKIDHSVSFFKINLKKAKYKDDLQSMESSHLKMIWPALTAAQRQQAVRLRTP
ncbi:MAG: hypothetical protein WCH62_07860 [Candidatus Omnitrophota bacterium]